jgi:hypothetical protein
VRLRFIFKIQAFSSPCRKIQKAQTSLLFLLFHAERKVFAAIKNTFAQRRKSLRKGDRFWSAALPGSQHPAEDSGVKKGVISEETNCFRFSAPRKRCGEAAPGYRPGAERFKEMKEVKNEEVYNSFGSLLFLLSTLRSIEEEYENEIDIS